MNGGRLSDDEAFLLGVVELRNQIEAAHPDMAATERAFTRIAVRFPEEAGRLRELWPDPEQCEQLLTELEAQQRADTDRD